MGNEGILMKRRLGIGFLLCAFAIYQHSFAVFQFSHPNSTVNVGPSHFVVMQPITNWTGTLAQTGEVTGSPITFNNGFLTNNNTPALATCTYVGNGGGQVTLGSNQSLSFNPGIFLPNISVIRSGNTIQGAPFFDSSPPSITLTSNLSQVTLGLNTTLGTGITMNGGSIILGNNLDIGDGNTLTGSGSVLFNKRRLSFGGADMTQTHTITYIDASDIVLHAKTFLYGQWIFGSSGTLKEAHITGNGNILDLAHGGTIWVKADVKLYLTDMTIKGLGKGWFVFENQGSQIILENASIQMDKNYTVTQGGFFVNAPSTIITRSNTLTFANNSTLTVDGVTLWYDTTISPNTFNIQPSVGSTNYSNMPNGKNIATTNNGRIAAVTTADAVRANSNAIIKINTLLNSEIATFTAGIHNNSTAILNLKNVIRTNSNAFAFGIKNNSNAIISLANCCRTNSNAIVNLSNQVRTNSNANAYCCRVNSNAIVYSNRTNSNAIVNLSNILRVDSNAFAFGIKNNSNAIVNLSNQVRTNSNANAYCCRVNSNAIVYSNRTNSNAIVNLSNILRVDSNAFAFGIKNNSNAIVNLSNQVRTNSNANAYCCRVNSNAIVYSNRTNSNAIVKLSTQVRTNSNANAYCCRVNSNAIIKLANSQGSNSGLIRTISNAMSYGIKNNSNALLYCCRTSSNAIVRLSTQVRTNSNAALAAGRTTSNAIVNLSKIVRTNSNAFAYGIKNNSNAIIGLTKCCKNNSNAIIKVSTDLKNLSAFVELLTIGTSSNVLSLLNLVLGISMSVQELQTDVNALTVLVNQNSNAIVTLSECCLNNSQRITNNSNAIISLSECCINNSQRITNNSNAIINLNNIVRVDSNAFAFGIKNVSNAQLYCCRTLSNAIAYSNRTNSNAIININNIVRTDSNAFAFGIKNNSNAIINLNNQIRTNSNANAYCCRVNSNAIVKLNVTERTNSNAFAYGIKNVSNALLYCCRTSSNAIANLSTIVRVDSNAFAYGIKNNSNAILALKDCCVNNSQRITNNSNAIINLGQRITNNSNAIISLSSCCTTNSQRITNNSNAILTLKVCCINNSQRITNNSNAIVYITNHSNANSALLIQTSNAVVSLSNCCKNNSNAIVAAHCCTIADAPLTSDVVMKCNCDIAPIKAINVLNNLTIDGQGAWIEFDEASHPQFVVAADTTVTLSNVSLLRVNGNTFSLGTNATIAISGLVVIEVSDDVTFTTENVVMLGTATNPSILIIRSPDNSRVFTIQPIVVGGVIQKTWNIGINTLEIQNLHLVGVESIQASSVVTPGGLLVGQVALGGNATVDIAQDTDLSFGVEHINNKMRLLANNLTLNNFLLYSPFFESQLHLTFNLPSVIVGNPVVNFADNLLFLSGVNGDAGLIFDDYWAVVFNQGVNSFDADMNSFISGRNLEIENFPIKQSSSDLILDSTLVFHTTLPNAIDSSFIKSPELSRAPGRPKIITALSMMYEQSAKITELKLQNEYARLERERKEKEILAERKRKEKEVIAQLIQQKQKPTSQKPQQKSPQKKNKKQERKKRSEQIEQEQEKIQDFEVIDNETLAKAFQIIPAPLQMRSFVVPTTADLIVKGSSVSQSQALGSIVVSNGTMTNFGASSTSPLTLYMIGDATLIEADSPDTKSIERMTKAVDNKDLNPILNANTTLNMQSDRNKVEIKQDSQINGTVITLNTLLATQTTFAVAFAGTTFDPDLLFVPTDGSTTIPTLNQLTLPNNSRVEFTGKGTLWINQGFFAALKPTPDTIPAGSYPRTTLAFTDGTKVKFNRTVVPNKLVPGATVAISSPFAPPTQDGEQVTIEGIGAVKIDLGAQMLVETGQRLVFGEAKQGDAKNTNIALSINRLGVLSVDTSARSIYGLIVKACPPAALISMQFGTYSIALNEGAILNIGCCGTYGINWDSTTGIEALGKLTSFTIKNRAVLNIEKTGRLVLGRNMPITGPGSNFGLGGKFLFDPFGGLITGNGIVALGNSGFEGVIQQVNAQPEYVTAQGFVRSLINTVPALKFATVFVDSMGNQKLFNAGFTTDPVTGAITLINPGQNPVLEPDIAYTGFITLMPGDKIISDDPVSGNVYGFNRGQRFTYTPDGTRVNN